jgi:Tol biopolymer transport system component
MKGMILIFLGALLVTACSPVSVPSSPTPTGLNTAASAAPTSGHIAFNAFQDSFIEIWMMNADGSGQIHLPTKTDEPDAYICAWSPDGTRILFVSEDEEPYEIYSLDAIHLSLSRLTDPIAYGNPAWSPDGKKIAFIASPLDNFEIYAMNADGTGQINLTNQPGSDTDPVWSPDGAHIAFVSERDGNAEIYVMNADGSGQKRLTYNGKNNMHPSWSPDGTQIAFTSEQNYSAEIYVLDVQKALDAANVSAETNITNNPAAYDQTPRWSPDGRQFAFVSDRDGDLEIYLMNVDGSGLTRLTDSPGYDADPAWSPDGSQIAFVSQRDGHFEIYRMDANGSDQTRLTNNPHGSVSPLWQP